jgi:hypothetical protein
MTESAWVAWVTVDSATDLPINVYNLTQKISGFFNYQWSTGKLVHHMTVRFPEIDITTI